jgi:hypothetical protein
LGSRSFKGRSILPPSIGHGEGSAGHRTASSSAALRLLGSRVSIDLVEMGSSEEKAEEDGKLGNTDHI